jgi:hypothetical protein
MKIMKFDMIANEIATNLPLSGTKWLPVMTTIHPLNLPASFLIQVHPYNPSLASIKFSNLCVRKSQ